MRSVVANEYRDDLKKNGFGSGKYGFRVPLSYIESKHQLRLFVKNTNVELNGSPLNQTAFKRRLKFLKDSVRYLPRIFLNREVPDYRKNMYSMYPFRARKYFDQLRSTKLYGKFFARSEFLYTEEMDQELSKIDRVIHKNIPESKRKAWLDEPNAMEMLEKKINSGEITKEYYKLGVDFVNNGYCVVESCFSEELIDSVWGKYERAVYSGAIPVELNQRFNKDKLLGRTLNPHHFFRGINPIFHDKSLLKKLSFLIGEEVTPFQSISSFAGSEQRAHSDAIHMTTEPLGFMIAAWVAFEDIREDAGPLEYYPGSHRLPYLFTEHLEEAKDINDKRSHVWYTNVYEEKIQQIIKEHNLKRELFLPKKGSVLIWHHNLIHGGSPRFNRDVSRKSFVFHYFSPSALCYSDRYEAFLQIRNGL